MWYYGRLAVYYGRLTFQVRGSIGWNSILKWWFWESARLPFFFDSDEFSLRPTWFVCGYATSHLHIVLLVWILLSLLLLPFNVYSRVVLLLHMVWGWWWSRFFDVYIINVRIATFVHLIYLYIFSSALLPNRCVVFLYCIIGLLSMVCLIDCYSCLLVQAKVWAFLGRLLLLSSSLLFLYSFFCCWLLMFKSWHVASHPQRFTHRSPSWLPPYQIRTSHGRFGKARPSVPAPPPAATNKPFVDARPSHRLLRDSNRPPHTPHGIDVANRKNTRRSTRVVINFPRNHGHRHWRGRQHRRMHRFSQRQPDLVGISGGYRQQSHKKEADGEA